jgi:hypothetical protein
MMIWPLTAVIHNAGLQHAGPSHAPGIMCVFRSSIMKVLAEEAGEAAAGKMISLQHWQIKKHASGV